MKDKITIIGLGYVGLPLAIEFGKKFKTVGFDIDENRVEQLKKGFDKTGEVEKSDFKKAKFLSFTSEKDDIRDSNIYIITVPTPIDKYKNPDLTFIEKASVTVAHVLKKGDIVIYESTVYPGTTEEFCVPILEKVSGLKFNKDFFCGYSPERINPGDKEHTLPKIKKIVSGSTKEITKKINSLYSQIIKAGTFVASSIRVAEAAKVIENAQRDINIAFVNELAIIFNKLNIDTFEVLEAASTKWNFLPFKPGIVGGHCIGVDPYYLTYKAEEIGYHPEIILAGRRLNDNMGFYVAQQVIKLLIKSSHTVKDSKILVLGITFKENCSDIRNTRVIDIINELKEFGCIVDIYDPYADKDEVKKEYQFDLLNSLENKKNYYDGIILAVAHDKFKDIDIIKLKKNKKSVIYDIKGFLPKNIITDRL